MMSTTTQPISVGLSAARADLSRILNDSWPSLSAKLDPIAASLNLLRGDVKPPNEELYSMPKHLFSKICFRGQVVTFRNAVDKVVGNLSFTPPKFIDFSEEIQMWANNSGDSKKAAAALAFHMILRNAVETVQER